MLLTINKRPTITIANLIKKPANLASQNPTIIKLNRSKTKLTVMDIKNIITNQHYSPSIRTSKSTAIIKNQSNVIRTKS